MFLCCCSKSARLLLLAHTYAFKKSFVGPCLTDQNLFIMAEKTPIFWALVGCAVVIIFLAVPAIVIGSVRTTQKGLWFLMHVLVLGTVGFALYLPIRADFFREDGLVHLSDNSAYLTQMALARGAIFVEVPVNSTGSSMVSGEGSTAGTASPTEGHSSAPAASTSSGE
jgi:hypothetical protein